jgi:hypothetical protein
MPVIETMSVVLKATTREFAAGMRLAREALGGFHAAGSQVAGLLGKLQGHYLAIAGALGIGAYVRSVSQSIEGTTEVARRFKVSTESLLGLQHHARLAGVEMQALGGFMSRLAARVSEAAKGTGPAVAALKELQLNAGVLVSLAPDEQLVKIADAMQRVSNFSDQARIAMDLFGKGGAEMISVMEGGAAALLDAQREAAKLGETFTRLEGEQIEHMNDAFVVLGRTIKASVKDTLISVSPIITGIAQELTDLVQTIRSFPGVVPFLFQAVRQPRTPRDVELEEPFREAQRSRAARLAREAAFQPERVPAPGDFSAFGERLFGPGSAEQRELDKADAAARARDRERHRLAISALQNELQRARREAAIDEARAIRDRALEPPATAQQAARQAFVMERGGRVHISSEDKRTHALLERLERAVQNISAVAG